ncbi:hypothetical protein TcWFU_005487 [Taenia crassiceps]|uniref:Uncharacterized protein n=1 Tax=Taenia crassiceps TaxID=6207 RepID=A0ABR4Q2R7_9CEST
MEGAVTVAEEACRKGVLRVLSRSWVAVGEPDVRTAVSSPQSPTESVFLWRFFRRSRLYTKPLTRGLRSNGLEDAGISFCGTDDRAQ